MSGRALAEWALKAAITAALMALLLRAIPLDEVRASLASAHLPSILGAFALILVMRAVAALRTRRLTDLQGMSLKVIRILQIGMASNFYGLLLPGSLSGGLVRWYKFSRQGATAPGALAVILVDRWAHLLTLTAVGIGFWCWSRPGGAAAMAGPGLVAVFAALAPFAVATDPARGPALATAFDRGLSWLPGFVGSKLRELRDALAAYQQPARSFLGPVLGISLVAHAVGTVAFLLLARALSLDLGIADVGWLRACIFLAVLLPLSVAGLGVREGALVLLLAPLGVPGADAVALGLLDFACRVGIAAVGGVWEVGSLRTQQTSVSS